MGITGAAVAWAVALVVRNVLPLVQVRTMLGMTPVSDGAIWVAVSAIACFGIVPAILRGTIGLQLSVALPTFAVCAVAYAALLWIGRQRIALTAFAGLLRRRVTDTQSSEKPTPAGATT